MATKITVQVDANKARDLIETTTGKDGKEYKNIKFELIEMKPESQKVVYEHEKFKLVKTHFAVKVQTKEEREAKAESVFVGDGITQIWKSDEVKNTVSEDINPEDIPF